MSTNANREETENIPNHPGNREAWNQMVPDILGRHLLRAQWIANRLAAEQDLRLLELEAEIGRLDEELEAARERMDLFERRGENLRGVGFGFVVFMPGAQVWHLALFFFSTIAITWALARHL
ncbi:hypothetical protein ACHAPU_002982 [Fusarium lateritium]